MAKTFDLAKYCNFGIRTVAHKFYEAKKVRVNFLNMNVKVETVKGHGECFFFFNMGKKNVIRAHHLNFTESVSIVKLLSDKM